MGCWEGPLGARDGADRARVRERTCGNLAAEAGRDAEKTDSSSLGGAQDEARRGGIDIGRGSERRGAKAPDDLFDCTDPSEKTQGQEPIF